MSTEAWGAETFYPQITDYAEIHYKHCRSLLLSIFALNL